VRSVVIRKLGGDMVEVKYTLWQIVNVKGD
jgi:hypothetical protein